jgi:predicted TIM-barrel fold metal-dependent hydrolase
LAAVAFLENLPVSPEDREKIAHRNADALLRLVAPTASRC